MAACDLIIRAARIVDSAGSASFVGDLPANREPSPTGARNGRILFR